MNRGTQLSAMAVVVCSMHAPHVFAFRPFDSTDADVAKAKTFELELGPIGRLNEGSKKSIVAPAIVANFGLPDDRELVLQGQRVVVLDHEADERRSSVVDNGLFIKQVLWRGALQGEPGVSVATEYGFLLPAIHGEHGSGFSVAGIVSQQWEVATLHFNGAIALNRDHEPELFLGVIAQGPHSWRVRPVAEVFTEQARGGERIHSRLMGAIWRVRDELAFDMGFRIAHEDTESIHEVRLGLTLAF